MMQSRPTRRSLLSYMTGGGVAVGALLAAGALTRSCAPVAQRTAQFDLSDMADGEARFYSFTSFAQIVVRRENALTFFDGLCPIDGRALMAPARGGLIWCNKCTSRFNLDGQITQFWSNPSPPDDAPNLVRSEFPTDGLSLLIADDQSLPRLGWTSL